VLHCNIAKLCTAFVLGFGKADPERLFPPAAVRMRFAYGRTCGKAKGAKRGEPGSRCFMTGMVAAVVVAAGRGERAGSGVPKQYRAIGGEPMVRATLSGLLGHPQIGRVQPVIHPADEATYRAAVAGLEKLPAPVAGGATRQASVLAGLEALAPSAPEIVLIHDAARPFFTPALVDRAIAAGRSAGAAVPGVAVSDTVKEIDAAAMVTATLDRARLRVVQTPQAFAFALILDAHRRAAAQGLDSFTDDAALAEWAGHRVRIFEGEAGNVKVTTKDDFDRAELAHLASLADIRTGNGFDVHAFAAGDHVMLGGIRIPHQQGLTGHSDADVALHALVDAILGALADGDIGSHFPPSDPQWKGASSDRFLAFACQRVRERRGMIAHLDVTVVCEAPRVSPHRDAMRTRIAEIAGIPASRVAVKATTSEKLGFTGRSEGMVAMATATVRLPWSAA
jgi:2-C-methyl-D-erythritol 4-phosphate cytidylyltransferase / 2-C-methyl-D-erythritol 2,4-cyclodiphosphate synthase